MAAATHSIASLPPFGGEVERGVSRTQRLLFTPLPNPPPQGGMERSELLSCLFA